MKINISRAPDDERVETTPILSEARARIIWGEHALSVRDYLISRGIERGAADLKIAQFLLHLCQDKPKFRPDDFVIIFSVGIF